MAQKDVFLCHASEDNATIVRPLAQALENASITYWFDEAEIRWGDSITGKVNEGLQASRYVIIVFSENFLRKNWPERELNAALNLESSSGLVRVLPLVSGNPAVRTEITKKYPLMNDKYHIVWEGEPQKVINELVRLLQKKDRPDSLTQSAKQSRYSIPIPKLKTQHTDQDQDNFLGESFTIIRGYFQEGLRQLEQHDKQIGTRFTEVTRLKFTCTVYRNGQVQNQCVIWLGGMSGSRQIAYREGQQIDIQHDASMNDWLLVEVNDDGIYLKSSGLAFSGREEAYNPEQGAEYLWKRFVHDL